MKKIFGSFMYWQCSPQKSKLPEIKNLKKDEKKSIYRCVKGTSKKETPFFSVLNERGTLRKFIDAVNKNKEDEARQYLSKLVSDTVDLKEAEDIFTKKNRYKCLFKLNEKKRPGISTVSMVVENEVINIHLVEEPDKVSSWKIISIDRE